MYKMTHIKDDLGGESQETKAVKQNQQKCLLVGAGPKVPFFVC